MTHIGLLYSILCNSSTLLLYYAFLVIVIASCFYLSDASRNVKCSSSALTITMQPWKSLVEFLLGSANLMYYWGTQIHQYKLERNFHQGVRVPVTLAVMSACPDAILCESVFDEVIGRLGHSKVAIDLTYIARFVPRPSSDFNCALTKHLDIITASMHRRRPTA